MAEVPPDHPVDDTDDDPFDVPEFDSWPRHVDRQGRVIGMIEWSRLMNDLLYKRVGLTYLHHVQVSTVWLGLDHSYRSAPHYYETMVFVCRQRDEHAPWAYWRDRYETEAEATIGHKRVVNKIRSRGVASLGTRAEERRWRRAWTGLTAIR